MRTELEFKANSCENKNFFSNFSEKTFKLVKVCGRGRLKSWERADYLKIPKTCPFKSSHFNWMEIILSNSMLQAKKSSPLSKI